MRTKVLKLVPSVLVGTVVVAGCLGYGYLCGVRHLPGYATMRRIHLWAERQPVIKSAYSLVTGRHMGERRAAPGAWNPIRTPDGADADAHRAASLKTLPYLSGYEKAPTADHVTVYDERRAGKGVNLYTSGDAPEAVLMDMRGRILHRWSYDFADAFPSVPTPKDMPSWAWWSRAHLADSGDLIAIYDGYGLVKVDSRSNLIWATPGAFHHDLFVDEKGTIYCLTRETKVLPRIHPYEPVVEDFITILDPDGNVIRNISLLEAMEHSSYAPLLENMPEYGDLLHTNTIEVCDGSSAQASPIFRKGNVLVSFALIDAVAIVDVDSEVVVWALTGQWDRQHCPTLLDNHHILLLDNLWQRRRSRVVEVDPLTQEITWSYEGSPGKEFYTKTFGTEQRLSNGNTLINESNAGRAFEVTPDNRIVWEFLNPARAGAKKELIATLFDFQRLDSASTAGWLSEAHAAR